MRICIRCKAQLFPEKYVQPENLNLPFLIGNLDLIRAFRPAFRRKKRSASGCCIMEAIARVGSVRPILYVPHAVLILETC